MSYKVKRMLLVIGFMVAGLLSYAGSCDESGSGSVNSAKPTTGQYRGQPGDLMGIADKINCPQGGCAKP
jgi:hypothetical protein